MSLAIFATIAVSAGAGLLASKIVDLGFAKHEFLAKMRAEAMDRHNDALEELLSDPSIGDEVKESVCFISKECFEKTSALRFLDYILSINTTSKPSEHIRESILVSEAIGAALDVAVTYGAERLIIPEKSRVSLMRRPDLAFAVAV